MFPDDKITEIFFMCDEFSKVFDQHIASTRKLQPSEGLRKRSYHRDCRMSDSEVMTIMIAFHNSGFQKTQEDADITHLS